MGEYIFFRYPYLTQKKIEPIAGFSLMFYLKLNLIKLYIKMVVVFDVLLPIDSTPTTFCCSSI